MGDSDSNSAQAATSDNQRPSPQATEARSALIAQRLKAKTPSGPTPAATPSRRWPDQPVDASPGQKRIWLFQSLHPDSSAYHMVEAYRAHGALDVGRLQSGLNRIIQRHEILRTTFEWLDGDLLQRIAPSLPVEIAVLDMRGHDANAIQAQIDHVSALPFELSAGPLLRFAVLQIAEQDTILVFVIHHIISDEHANRLFWSELAALYAAPDALSTGDAPQYADFAEAQIQPDSAAVASQITYWTRLLADSPPQHGFPLDRPRPSAQTYVGRLLGLTLPADLSQRLRACAQENRVSMAMLVHAAYALLLHRYSGHSTVLIGVPVSQRDRPLFEQMLGFFLNTVAIRVDIDGGSPFRDLLKHVRERVLGALDHRILPFDELVEALAVNRDPSIHPLFQVMFVYREGQPPALPGLTLTRHPVDQGVAKFDMTLFAADEGEQIALQIEYNTDLFDAPTMARLLDHLRNLLDSVTANPVGPLSEAAYLSPSEQRSVLFDWNATDLDYAQKGLIVDLIRDQAAATPDAPALLLRDESLTYSQLEHRAAALAQQLLSHGTAPGIPILLCFERSFEMFIAMLACLKVGCPYVPVDPAYPAERVRRVLEDSASRLLLTQRRFVSALSEYVGDRPVLAVDDLPLDTPPSPTQTLPVLDAETPAYILYTSGSTGQPKGVVITHGNLTHSTLARHAYYPERVERYLLLSPYVFDSSVAGIYWTLTQGGALVLPEPGGERDADQLVDLIEQRRVTHTLCLPSLYAVLLETARPGQLDSLRTVIVAGEACPASLIDAHTLARPQAALINEYGPTEGTVWATVHRITAEDAGRIIPIGRPIANMQAYILDRYLQPLPAGVPGELYIAGKGLADRYLNQPALTAERFLDFPLTGRRIYRTGDLARWTGDGRLDFLGRADQQVKIRGHRIEPGEIENTLLRHEQVESAVVLSVTAAQTELVAFVTLRSDGTLATSALREFLLAHLPDYMAPARIHRLDALPLTFNGKVDRAALLQHDAEQAPEQEQIVIPPRNATEAAIAAVWSDLLGVQGIGINDDFFELGGHSLLAMRVISQINRRLKSKLSVPDLLQYPTVEALARQAVPEAAPPIAQPIAGPEAPASPAITSPHVVPIQTQGTGPFLWGFTRGQLGVFAYVELSKLMGDEVPVYALRLPGLDGEAKPYEDIAALATYYIGQIKRFQPSGPYVLAGYSIAGLIAYEVAQQLQAGGDAVELLIMFETVVYGESTVKAFRDIAHFRRQRTLRRILSIPRYLLELARLRGDERKAWLDQRRQQLPDLSPEAARNNEVKAAVERASNNYRMQPYQGAILYFATESGGASREDEGQPSADDWTRLARGEFQRITVPGTDHRILGGEHTGMVAEIVREHMRRRVR